MVKEKERSSEIASSEQRLECQWNWLWDQVQTFAHHNKESNTVLMVIEPEQSKSSWETWVQKDGEWVARSAPAAHDRTIQNQRPRPLQIRHEMVYQHELDGRSKTKTTA